jgi:hypothetical protein
MPFSRSKVAAISVLALITAPASGNPPSGGNKNYQFYSPGQNGNSCQPIDGLTVTIDVDQDIISNDGFAFQLNGASQPGDYQGWPQYVISLTANPFCFDCQTPLAYKLDATTEPWPKPGGDLHVTGNIANTSTMQQPAFLAPIIPKGYRFIITLQSGGKQHKIQSVHYQAFAPPDHSVAVIDQTLQIADLPSAGGQPTPTITTAALSSLNVFNVVLVGPTNGYRAHLSSGAGKITYTTSSGTPLRSALTVPANCANTGNSTLENSNSTYTALPTDLGASFKQDFSIASEPPYTPGGPLAATRHADGHNRIYVADVAAQLVELDATSTGAWSTSSAAASPFLMDGRNDLVAIAGGDGTTQVVGVDQDGGAVAFTVNRGGGWDPATTIQPHHGMQRFGARVAAATRGGVAGELDYFGVDGKTEQLTVTRDSGGTWGSDKTITPQNTLTNFAGLVASPRYGVPDETDVFAVNGQGRLILTTANGGGAWTHRFISSAHKLAPSGSLAVTEDAGTPNQTDLFSIDGHGDLVELTSLAGATWSPVKTIAVVGNLVHGGRLAASRDFGTRGQTDVFTFNNHGTLEVFSADAHGTWSAPTTIAAATAPPGAAIVAIKDSSVETQTDVFYIDKKGQPSMVWSAGGNWQGPTALTKPCVPGYTEAKDGACYQKCAAPGTVLGSNGTCDCVAGTTRNSAGGCSTCPADSFRNIDGSCTRLCNTIHSIATAGTCGCAAGYTMNAAGICAACATSFSSVPPMCVPPKNMVGAQCTVAGGSWEADTARCVYDPPGQSEGAPE